jgi:hypothetical protein
MRPVLALSILAASAGAADAAAPAAGPSRAAAPVRPTPVYVVVEGSHTWATDAGQKLTVFCPAGRRALGAGYSAVVRTAPTAQGGQPGQAEGGLDRVRSFPDMQGAGWQVSGVSQDAVRLKQPWRLVVRVVCLQVPG